jgi:hypothetical protein
MSGRSLLTDIIFVNMLQWLNKYKVWIICGFMALSASFYYRYDLVDWLRELTGFSLPEDPRPAGVSDLEWCYTNYHEEISEIATEYEMPYEYLMALIVLECSGNKPAGHRFEKGVFNQLKKVRDGKQKKFENIHQQDLQDCDDDCLANLATSWGPFQIMGYKVIPMGINITDLRDDDQAARHAVEWIKKEYSRFLVKKKWRDAFHYHNTGDRFPLSGRSRTHDPYYVSDGIKYMKYFESKRQKGKSSSIGDS